MKLVKKEKGALDNWRCNDAKWPNLGQNKDQFPPMLVRNTSLFKLLHRTLIVPRIMIITRVKLRTSMDLHWTCLIDVRPATAPLKGKGMQLGKKTNTRLYNALNNEIGFAEETSHAAIPSLGPVTQETYSKPTATEGIQVSFTETTSAKAYRDGGIESMEVQGQLNLHISDIAMSRIQIGLQADDSDGTQFKTHPNVDRNLFKDHNKIGLRDPSRPFPLNQQMSVLRWRLQAKPEKIVLPISGLMLFS